MGKMKTKSILSCAVLVAMISGVQTGYALPVPQDGGRFDAQICDDTHNKTMNIRGIRDNNVLNWQTFDITSAETVKFDNGEKIRNYLNLIHDNKASEILGTLTGGGNIYLVNPNGVIFGDNSSVNVGNLYVSTRNMDNNLVNNFLAGNNPLSLPASVNGDIIVLGSVTADKVVFEAKDVYFEGPCFMSNVSKANISALGDISINGQRFSASDTPAGLTDISETFREYMQLNLNAIYAPNKKIATVKNAKEILYVDNYGTIAAGRYRYGLQGNVQFSEAAGTLNYGLIISNGKQHNYNLGYSQSVGRSGTRLGLNVSRGDYELGGVFSQLQAQGDAVTVGLNGSTPILNTWKDSLNINYGYNYRKLTDELNLFSIDMKKHSHSVYAGVDGTMKRGKFCWEYEVTDTAGKLGLDNDWAQFMYGASDTEGFFNKVNFNNRFTQTFDRHFDLQFKFSGQMASNNLDGSEEIVLGGINGVRAYPTGVGSGDEGYMGSVELRYHTKVPGLILSAYLDGGQVFVTHDRSSLTYGKEIAKGWGLGMTYVKPGNYFMRLDYARRIGELKYYSDKDAKDRNRLWFMAGKVL